MATCSSSSSASRVRAKGLYLLLMFLLMHSTNGDDLYSSLTRCLSICGTRVAACTAECYAKGIQVSLCILDCTEKNQSCMSDCAEPAQDSVLCLAPAPR